MTGLQDGDGGILATLFSDFNCPFCHALGLRLTALGRDDAVRWGVQHAPELPIPMPPTSMAGADPALARALVEEVDSVRRLMPEAAIALPRGKPNTGPATALVAAAARQDPARADALRSALYHAFWRDGADISDPDLLARLATEAGLTTDALDRDAGREESARWQSDWARTGLGCVPLLLRRDGRALPGLVDDATLRAFLAPA